MPAPPSQPCQVLPAPAHLRRAALELVFCDTDPSHRARRAERLIAAANVDQHCLEGLLIAQRGVRMVGAVLAQVQPGRVAGFWPPVTTNVDDPCCDQLLAAAIQWIETRNVRLAQALSSTDCGARVDGMLRHGFRHMADLLYMVCVASHFPQSPPAGPLKFVVAPIDDLTRLELLIARTYEGSHDCPALNGVRDMSDVLDGYRATGVHRPERWLLAQHEDRDVGCLLLADHPSEAQSEIVYTGLVPEARGRGWGGQLVRHAQWVAHVAGRERLVLATDAANAPAIATYEAAGFAAWNRRFAFLRVCSEKSAPR